MYSKSAFTWQPHGILFEIFADNAIFLTQFQKIGTLKLFAGTQFQTMCNDQNLLTRETRLQTKPHHLSYWGRIYLYCTCTPGQQTETCWPLSATFTQVGQLVFANTRTRLLSKLRIVLASLAIHLSVFLKSESLLAIIYL